MDKNGRVSILYPYEDVKFRQLSRTACHDLGLDTICKELSESADEQRLIMNVLSNMTDDAKTAQYRTEVFEDILGLSDMRKRMMELFEKIEFIRDYSSGRMETDEKLGFWHLMHRLREIDDYIKYVEEMRVCLADEKIRSRGMLELRGYIDELYNEAHFEQMKKDISELRSKSDTIQSVTLGVNVNDRFEATGVGLVSVNSKQFKKSGIVGNFADAIASKDKVHDDTDWNGDMHYHQIDKIHDHELGVFVEGLGALNSVSSSGLMDNRIRATVVNTIQGDNTSNTTFYLDKIMNKLLTSLVKKLRDVLSKYAEIAVVNISKLIPEFVYYIRMAEFVEKQTRRGFAFCRAQTTDGEGVSMDARGLYNLKLAVSVENSADIVPNDLVFDKERRVYILTGANRGGKTTITQGIGLLYVLAQGGIYVPAQSFLYRPADAVYTHFPADEDKTMDLGRLGEECVRFKEIYSECTEKSLVLLNETFSTTSFEEGYYIAVDSVRALLKKGARTVYNTHMHKLAADTGSLGEGAASIIVKSDGGKRSFKVVAAPPEGLSYARDIAEKYGVTYEMLTGEK